MFVVFQANYNNCGYWNSIENTREYLINGELSPVRGDLVRDRLCGCHNGPARHQQRLAVRALFSFTLTAAASTAASVTTATATATATTAGPSVGVIIIVVTVAVNAASVIILELFGQIIKGKPELKGASSSDRT